MIEAKFRTIYQRLCIDPLLPALQRVQPNFITILACMIGISTLPLLAFDYPVIAFFCLMISGFLDTLDGSLARFLSICSPQGTVLDIFCDRVVECAVLLGLYAVDPSTRSLPTLLMLSSILICVTSFLVVGIFTENASEKSFYYSPGLIERAEAFLFFGAMMLCPQGFLFLAYLFSFLVLLTASIRMVQFQKR